MSPTELNGDRLPAFAPFATISAINSGDTPAVALVAIASGAMSAVAAMAPGPRLEATPASPKNSQGNAAVRPRHARTARSVSAASVWLRSAAPNNNVTPNRVRKSDDGNAAMSASTFHPAANVATSQASAIASTPTLMRDVRLSTMTASSATSESDAGVIRWSMVATGASGSCRARCAGAGPRARTPAAS